MTPIELFILYSVIGLGAFIILIAFIKANLVIAAPNEVVVITGRKRKIIRGKRAFVKPIVEKEYKLSLNAIQVEFNLKDVLAKGLIPLNIAGTSNIKIDSSPEGIEKAIERFLGKPDTEIARVSKEIIEGTLRGVVAKHTPEEINENRLKIEEEIKEIATKELSQLGIKVDVVKIHNLSDSRNYLDNIARKKAAMAKKEAEIAESSAEKESRVYRAGAMYEAKKAEIEAEEKILDEEKNLGIKKAQVDKEIGIEKIKSKVEVKKKEVLEEKEVEKERIELEKLKNEADIVIPAEAKKKALELEAIGKSAIIREKGLATAKAIDEMRKEWEKGETKDLFLINLLPELTNIITGVLKDNLNIEKITLVGEDALPGHVQGLTRSITSILEGLKTTTGIDIIGTLAGKDNNIKNGIVKKEME